MSVEHSVEHAGLLIAGRWEVSKTDGAALLRTDPADSRCAVATVAQASAEDVGRAFDGAQDAFRPWYDAGAISRGRILIDAAAALRARAARTAVDIVRENGKTLAEATAEVEAAASFLEFFGGLGRGPWGTVLADRRPSVRASTSIEPLGPVLLITPWNDPLLTPARKLGPALIAGNTVVLKPSEQTPLSARHLAEVLMEAGLPDGVLGIVSGEAGPIAEALVGDPRIRAVSFTGSERVGLQLRRRLADTHVRVQCELGGKNAALVLADADLDRAAAVIAAAAFGQGGQRCTATSRVMVAASVMGDLARRLQVQAAGLRVGHGLDTSTQIGALVSDEHRSRLEASITLAQREGADVMGGARPTDAELGHGNFLAPAVLTGLPRSSVIWEEELFGPVVTLTEVVGLEDGIDAVNDSRFGLAASVFTRDLASVTRFVSAVDVGQVAVNLPTIGWDVHVPFGGFRASGSAFKEHGIDGLAFYTRTKSVVIG